MSNIQSRFKALVYLVFEVPACVKEPELYARKRKKKSGAHFCSAARNPHQARSRLSCSPYPYQVLPYSKLEPIMLFVYSISAASVCAMLI